MSELKLTPLHDTHVAAGATMVDFGGWEMPIQSPSGIVAEHLNTRRNCGIFDVSHTDVSEQVSAAFQCSHLVFASATYNGGIYTPMETLLLELKAHALQNRTVALIENGSWGPAAARLMAKHLEEMKGMEQIAPPITIRSAVKEEQYRKLEDLADLIAADIAAEE